MATFTRRVSGRFWVDKARLQQDEARVKGAGEETMSINNMLRKFDCEGKSEIG